MNAAMFCSLKYIQSATFKTINQSVLHNVLKGNHPCFFILLDSLDSIDLAKNEISKIITLDRCRFYFLPSTTELKTELCWFIASSYNIDNAICFTEDETSIDVFELGDFNNNQKTSHDLSSELGLNVNVLTLSSSIELDEVIERIRNLNIDFDPIDIANLLAKIDPVQKNTLHIDISTLIHFDHATGIQRVVKELSNRLLESELPMNSKLVYSYPNHTHFYNATDSGRAGDPYTIEDDIVDFHDGDILLFLDLHPSNAYTKNEIIKQLQHIGVKSYFVVYDLLPISHPHCFVQELVNDFEQWLATVAMSNGAMCISNDVRDKLNNWIEVNSINKYPEFRSEYFHLGADFNTSIINSNDEPPQHTLIEPLLSCDTTKTYLMVGTVEPRKGHKDVLEAFEAAWSNGSSNVLIIVGKEGWRNEELISRLKTHPERDRKLFWLQGLSDGYLDYLYRNASCLIAASEGEGFGLPLIEAAQYGLPIIARDIPVFREVAGEHALYFSERKEEKLERLLFVSEDAYLDSKNIPFLTWNKSTNQLIHLILGEN
ncbi:glycosyltransferase family 4 protein [Vibrio sp. MA40-2]|uniref:glycosyltransferase family 4 protein n=1 Tax=Vibrio sp. MA40-2 TaxID=3391828 RepID=UPI0039A5F032